MKGGKPVQMQERKTMLRTVCMLSWPTVLEQALQTGAQYVDTAMVGRIGMQASAAVGLTASAMWLITGPLAAIGMGVLSCISKAIGAEDRQVDDILTILRQNCAKRSETEVIAPHGTGGVPTWNLGYIPIKVEVGGATVFILEMEQFIKL